MSVTLRPYQRDLLARSEAEIERAALGALIVSPVGSGKTRMQAARVHSLVEAGQSACVFVHRRELMRQQLEAIRDLGIPCGIVDPDNSPSRAPAHVASIDTMAARLGRIGSWASTVGELVFDEGHHMPSNRWATVRRAFENARSSAWTATAFRLTGEGLGEHFDGQAIGPSVRALTELGWLAPLRIIEPPMPKGWLDKVGRRAGDYAVGELETAVDQEAIRRLMVEHWMRWGSGRPTLGFTVTVAHARHLAEAFRSIAGIRAVAVDGGTDGGIRDRAILGLADGSVDMVLACEIIGEGLNIPRCACGLMARPTMSVGKMIQQMGRTQRVDDEFDDALIIDVAGLARMHGMPDEPRPWSLLQGIKGMERRVPKPVRCDRCYRVQAVAEACCECGRPFVTLASRPGVTRAQLSPALRDAGDLQLLQLAGAQLVGLCETRADREYIVQLRGYKPGWVWWAENEKRERPWLYRARKTA